MFLHFDCVPLCFVFSLLACERRGDVEPCWHPFCSHRRTSTGNALLLVRSHVACVSKPRKNGKFQSKTPHAEDVEVEHEDNLWIPSNNRQCPRDQKEPLFPRDSDPREDSRKKNTKCAAFGKIGHW